MSLGFGRPAYMFGWTATKQFADPRTLDLDLGRDVGNGEPEEATGVKMLHVQPGTRLYKKALTIALGVKWPAWTDLNEEADQQGAERTEDYRIEFTFSTPF